MASFNGHLVGAMAASGVAATALLLAGVAAEGEVLRYFALGTLGGLLPDLDADNSKPLRMAFFGLSLWGAFMAVFVFAGPLSLLPLVGVWLAAFLLLRYGVLWLFTRYTVHRGVWHSLPAGVLAGLLTALVCYHGCAEPAALSWWSGVFVTFGYWLHLLLDELASTNLMGVTLRRSFGSAFKLWSGSALWASGLLYLGCAAALWFAPPAAPFMEHVTRLGSWVE